MSTDIRTIGIIGAGTMGSGIAQAAAGSGYFVILEDVSEALVDAGVEKIRDRLDRWVSGGKLGEDDRYRILSNLHVATSLEDLKDADLIIEAAPEDERLKKAIFPELDRICADRTVFTTNTSSVSVTRLAGLTRRPERFAGMHFMNPAYAMKLVEIVRGMRTSEETVRLVASIAARMEKVPVVVNDSPGFISNRVLMPMINDAVFCLEEGIASKEDIDTVMKLGAGHPMGPLELADFIGLDVCLAVMEVLHSELGEKYRPCPLLNRMVSAGMLGKKRGEGFYKYE